jgi:hypothetical protein
VTAVVDGWAVRPDRRDAVAGLAAGVVGTCADPALGLDGLLARANWVMRTVERLDADARHRPEWSSARRCWHQVNRERLDPSGATARRIAVDGLCDALTALVRAASPSLDTGGS